MRRNWIKIYVDQCLRGTMFQEMEDPAERFVWFGFLLLAGDSPFEGKIALTENIGFTDEQLSEMLKCPIEILLSAKDKMIKYEKIRVSGKNIIEILKWNKYQSEYRRQRPYREESYRRKLHPKVTTEDDAEIEREMEKEKREEKKENKSKPLCPNIFSDIDIKLTQLLIDLILRNDPNSSIIRRLTPKRQETWMNECRKIREIDKRTPEQIEKIIIFSQDDSFWKSNILSMPKLRKQFDQLWLKAKKEKYSGIKEWLNDE